MTGPQGEGSIEPLCAAAGVSRASFYRRWSEAQPAREETALRDVIQPYENVSEYIRDLIRRDKERAEAEAFGRLKAELVHAFSAPESSYAPLTAVEVIARNRA